MDSYDLEALGTHRGAIDRTTITTQPPATVMKRINAILLNMGVHIQEESAFKYRCIRAKNDTVAERTAAVNASSLDPPDSPSTTILYGAPSEDPTDEVRFSVELTRLGGLNDTYSLDIRRLKGNLRSYKFIYDTIRDRAELSR
ncbi:hypothetical protein B0H34DRAFT_72238 [Crassisporium funariophilum]|nr:hypothetical protein B0H34DRAFT_72238 [Crassisporium funariophilum]